MSSAFDPRQARWERVETPACQGGVPAVVRTAAPADLADIAPSALLDDATAGLTGWFPSVLPIDATVDPPETLRGATRLLHAAIDRNGGGMAIETLMSRDGEVTCWVSPATRYAAELPAARRAMAGRPPLKAPEDPEQPGVPVAEARLTVAGDEIWTVQRRGPLAQAVREAAEPERLLASALPVWLSSVTGMGPRPAPDGHGLLITSRSALERLLDLTAPGDAAVRAALDAPGLSDEETARLRTLVHHLTCRWTLEWTSGQDDAQEPADDGWSTARVTREGRLEVLDAGEHGLWRVLSDLPEAIADDLPGDEEPVALVRAAASDIWQELTVMVADRTPC